MRKRMDIQNAVRAEATTSVARGAMPTGYARLVALQNSNIDALLRFNMILRDGAVEWSDELLDFTGRHLQHQLTRPVSHVNGAAPAEIAASHLRYIQTVAEQSLEQAARFLTLAARLSRDSRVHLENHAVAMINHLRRDDGSLQERQENSTGLSDPAEGADDIHGIQGWPMLQRRNP